MTLREMRAAYPDRFYKQDWYQGEAFMDREPKPNLDALPIMLSTGSPNGHPPTLSAADLAYLWVNDYAPDHSFWSHYFWTSDFDRFGQRVYVGQNGKGLEIHRHLHLTDRWVTPI